ncbi:hypothetical protein GCM10027614_61930 [Micromonospora vulcania]
MPQDSRSGVVIGVDIGTTSTKAVAYDTGGRQLASHSVGYPLNNPQPGYAEQDPQVILDAVLESVRTVVTELAEPVAGLSFSSAMHSLIGLNPDGDPITPSVTWADSRSSRQAERLRAVPSGLALHRRTGTPVHPMAPLPKLLWFAEQEPALFEQVAHWVGIKDWVLLRLCDALVTDHSVASATGLLNIHELEWDGEALAMAGITEEQLPQLVGTTAVLPGLTPQAAAVTGLPQRTPVVVGAGDGPLANLGLGAVHPGMVACSIGTSGAMRVMVERPGVDPLGGVFCYALTEDRWVVGGAINNGGIVLKWAGDALAPDLGEHAHAELVALAAQAPVGSGGLIMLPYLLSERAPHWSALPRGAYVGLTHGHRREHLVRAALEGLPAARVGAQLGALGRQRGPRDPGRRRLRPQWPVAADARRRARPAGEFPRRARGVELRRGAARHAGAGADPQHRRGSRPGADRGDGPPRPGRRATYASLLPLFAELYDALVPTFTSLRRLAPGLPPELAPEPPPM